MSDHESIVIERREVVATIVPDPHGTQTMLGAAFQAASEYLMDEVTSDRPLHLSWEYSGRTWYVGTEQNRPSEVQ